MLKRAKNLKRKTPLRSHKIGQPPKYLKKTPLKRFSDKRRKELHVYCDARLNFLERNPKCRACKKVNLAIGFNEWHNPGIADSEDVHHLRGRLGTLFLDERYWMAVCRLCHDYIHRHGTWARTVNLLHPSNQDDDIWDSDDSPIYET